MAIIVQEEKTPINWLSVISWASVIGIVFISGYYLFFVQPPLVEFVLPIKLSETATLAKIKFDPSFLIESEIYKVLEKGEYGQASVPSNLGRANPFLNFAPIIKPGRTPINIKSATSTSTSTPISAANMIKLSATSSLSSSSVSTSTVSQPPFFVPPASPSSSPQ